MRLISAGYTPAPYIFPSPSLVWNTRPPGNPCHHHPTPQDAPQVCPWTEILLSLTHHAPRHLLTSSIQVNPSEGSQSGLSPQDCPFPQKNPTSQSLKSHPQWVERVWQRGSLPCTWHLIGFPRPPGLIPKHRWVCPQNQTKRKAPLVSPPAPRSNSSSRVLPQDRADAVSLATRGSLSSPDLGTQNKRVRETPPPSGFTPPPGPAPGRCGACAAGPRAFPLPARRRWWLLHLGRLDGSGGGGAGRSEAPAGSIWHRAEVR